MSKVVIDPVTRVEGHIRLELELEGGVVAAAKCSGSSFRGIEVICQGRDPLDAAQLTQRICGLCSMGHGIAAAQAAEQACQLEPPPTAKLIRKLLLAGSFVASHILNFYQLALPDYLGPEVAEQHRRQLERHQGTALDMFRKANEALALLAGRVPHAGSIVVGGVTEQVTAQKVVNLLSRVRELGTWAQDYYRADVRLLSDYYPQYWAIGGGNKSYLSYEGLDGFFAAGFLAKGIKETIDPAAITEVAPAEATTFVNTPRYKGNACETGALARQLVQGNKELTKLGERASSVWGRHVARAEEAVLLTKAMVEWLYQLEPGQVVSCQYKPVVSGRGEARLESPAGALSHGLVIHDSKIAEYRIISGSTWNLSSQDQEGQPGPVEQALMGVAVADSAKPVEALRVLRSFDLCMSCAVHLIQPRSDLTGYRIG